MAELQVKELHLVQEELVAVEQVQQMILLMQLLEQLTQAVAVVAVTLHLILQEELVVLE